MAPYTVTNSFRTGRVLQTYGRVNLSTKRDFYSLSAATLDSEPVSKRARIDKGKQKEKSTSNEAEDSDNDIMTKCIHQAYENVMKRCRAAKNAEAVAATTSTTIAKPSTSTSTTRLNTDAPSSPVSHTPAIFDSDPAAGEDSELSSPPPQLSPPKKTRRPTFAVTKRKQEAQAKANGTALRASGKGDDALAELQNGKNVNGHAKPGAKSEKNMVQTQLDLGQEKQKTCKDCGMTYMSSDAGDNALHKIHHKEKALAMDGIFLGNSFLDKVEGYRCFPQVLGEKLQSCAGDNVVYVSGNSPPGVKKPIQKAMDVVTRDLGAVPFDYDKLWKRLTIMPPNGDKDNKNLLAMVGSNWDNTVDQYRIFLYLRGEMCIGFLLTERIKEGRVAKFSSRRTEGANSEGDTNMSSSITLGKWRFEAVMGISRIWVAQPHRSHGIAKHLLECARTNFIGGVQVEYRKIAFSQPTESGIKLARSFFRGRTDGGEWLVYDEEKTGF